MAMIHEKRGSLTSSKTYRERVGLKNFKYNSQRLVNIKRKGFVASRLPY